LVTPETTPPSIPTNSATPPVGSFGNFDRGTDTTVSISSKDDLFGFCYQQRLEVEEVLRCSMGLPPFFDLPDALESSFKTS
jgi:hypothetical protein